MSEHEDASAAITLRVTLGVIGHRNLADPAGAATLIRCRLQQALGPMILSRCPSRLLIWSALAEGADRLVVKEAIKLLGQERVELHAVLPLPREDYATDFATAESRAEFGAMLGAAREIILTTSTPTSRGAARDTAYALAGRRVVDESELVVAVWDGEEAQRPRDGGTGDTVAYARSRGAALLVVPAARAGRQSDPRQESEGDESAFASWRSALSDALARIGQYDRIASAEVAARVAEDRPGLLAAGAGSSVEPAYVRALEWGLPLHVRAELLARHYQVRYRLFSRLVHYLAAAAVCAVAVQVVFAPKHPAWLSFEIASLLALIVVLSVARRHRYIDRWQGYRSLAEAFRTAIFISLTTPWSAEQASVSSRRRVMMSPWFQRAFSEAWAARPADLIPGGSPGALRQVVVDGWLKPQIDYHRRTAERMERIRSRLSNALYALAGVTSALALCHILRVGPDWAERWLELVAICLPGIGAAIAGLREQGQYRLHAERSRRTAARLHALLDVAEPPAEIRTIRRLVLRIQRVIVEENLDWSSVLEFQEPEFIM